MPRCIVLIRSHELLQEGWRKRSFEPAGPLLDTKVQVAGVRFDETYHPVQVWRRIGGGDDPPAASGCNATASLRLSACSPTLPSPRSPPPTAAPPRSVPRRTSPEGSASRRSPGWG